LGARGARAGDDGGAVAVWRRRDKPAWRRRWESSTSKE
jgi:hypothetical protein